VAPEPANQRAARTIAAASTPQVPAAISGVQASASSRSASKPVVADAISSRSSRSSTMAR